MGLPRIEIKPKHTTTQAKRNYDQATTTTEKKRAHFIWLLLSKTSLEEAKEIVSYSHPTALKIIKNYNQKGFKGLVDARTTNQGRPPLLSDAQLLLLAQTIRRDFKQGMIWDAQKVRAWMEEQTGVEIHLPRAYEMISKINCSFQMPRPQHDKNDSVLMDEFKKNAS